MSQVGTSTYGLASQDMSQTVRIERMSYGPDGIAHLEGGKTVFVSGGSKGVVPGDLVRIQIDSEHKRFDRAHVVELIEPSDLRSGANASAIAPWAPISYAEQLRQKADSVRNAFARTAGLERDIVESVMRDIIPSPSEWGYRNKVELLPTTDDRGKLALGFADHLDEGPNDGDARSTDGNNGTPSIVPIKSCPLGNNLLERAPASLSGAIRFIMSRSGEIELQRVGIRASTRTGKMEVALWTPPSAFPRSLAAKVIEDATHATSIVRVISDGTSARKVKKVEVLSGDGYWRERLAGCSFKVSAPSFFQVNTDQAETLVKLVVDAVSDLAKGQDGALRIADVYSGVGTFSIPLAKRFPAAEVSAIELAGSSARDFERNCRTDDASAQIDFICDDAARALPMIGQQDVVIVDPPRAGLGKEALKALVDAPPELIAYVSCDPQTLARDAKELVESGFRIRSITPVDMFPQTYHVETVAVFERSR